MQQRTLLKIQSELASLRAMRGGARRVPAVGLELDLALREALATAAVVETPARRRVAEGLIGAIMLSWSAPAVADEVQAADLGGSDGDHEAAWRRRDFQIQQSSGGAYIIRVRRFGFCVGVDAQGTLGVLGLDHDRCSARDLWLEGVWKA